MAERQAKVVCLLPERSRCALHGSCNLLDWRLASRVCPQLSDILPGPGSAFTAPRSFGCHQIPPIYFANVAALKLSRNTVLRNCGRVLTAVGAEHLPTGV